MDWLRDLFTAADATADADITLVAVGGHGRSELAPGSDP
jgi:UTP:GlnB (protein PII) uridylyltransferase